MSTVMYSIGIFTVGGEFELDLTSYLFYKFITTAVVSTIVYCSIVCMVGGLFCFFFPPL